jgi:hypothetical protein
MLPKLYDMTESFLANDAWVANNRHEYQGKWVAISHGKLVDYDIDGASLQKRVAQREDAEQVLVTLME